MTAFVALLFSFPVLIGLWRCFTRFRKPRSESALTVLSIGSINQTFTPQTHNRESMCRPCRTRIPQPEAAQDQVSARGCVTPALYYIAAWTDGGSLLRCRHLHQTVISAANCISEAGGYVIAVEKGRLRALNDVEEEQFRYAYYGPKTSETRLLGFKPIRAFKPSLN